MTAVPDATVPDAADHDSDAPVVAGSQAGISLPEIPGGWTVSRRRLAFSDPFRSDPVVEGSERNDRSRALAFIHPADPDLFLDDPQVLEANRRDDYMPYWAYLWPSAGWMSASLSQAHWPADTEVLELGCGLGLVGLAALAAGWRVTFSDYDPLAVACAVRSAGLNGWADRANGLELDWRIPVQRQWPVILGNDLTYEVRNHGVLLDLLSTMLTPGGVCWLGDPGRMTTAEFVRLAESRQWQVDRLHYAVTDTSAVPTDPATPAGAQVLILRQQRS